MGIGVRERRTFRGINNAQVLEFPFAAGQSPADLAEAMGPAKLTEQHGDELSPAAEPFSGVIGAMLFNGLFEFQARE